MTPTPDPFVILVAPNVSEQMGGEAIKAFQALCELRRQGVEVHLVTHDRVRAELTRRLPGVPVTYVPDTLSQKILYRSRVLRPALWLYFQRAAARRVRALIPGHPGAVVHYVTPVSPVNPYPRVGGAPVVIGPQNGNIFHPPAFRAREAWSERLRRVAHVPLQRLHRRLSRGKQSAAALIVSGGERTKRSLLLAGCRPEQFVDTADCGVPEHLRDRPRVRHAGANGRFVHNGRLVGHKGADLAIKALARTAARCTLDIIGRGPARAGWQRLAAELGVADRVTFIEWFPNHDDLAGALRTYRGFVFPSLAEANGIVVQEAMMMGLPTICLDWGGPGLLITPESGFLIEPRDEDYVVGEIARAMDRLAGDGELADRMAAEGRRLAEERGYAWPDLIRVWRGIYDRVLAGRAATGPGGAV